MDTKKSVKHLQLDKAKQRLFLMMAVGSMIVVFGLVAAKSLYNNWNYRRHVVDQKTTALSQIKSNIEAVASLKTTYEDFNSLDPNLIGGSSTGSGARDGDNARIVLDALPSKYDFPALVSSVEKMIIDRGLSVQTIGGTDDEISNTGLAQSTNPQAIPINLSFTATGTYKRIQGLVSDLDRSIRPFNITSIDMSSNGSNNMTVSMKLVAYFQPTKSVSITSKEVK